jgi:hypothetical protein
MPAATLSRLQAEIDALAARVAPPPAVLSPVDLARAAGLQPDPWQVDVLGSTASRLVMLCARQSGTSTIAAVLAAHRAITTPGALILLVAPALRQAGELARKVRAILAATPAAPPPVVLNVLSLELSNGSRIVTLPGKEATVRGFSAPDLVIEDESSRCPDELHHAIRPMLATSGGALLLLSTPAGKRGHFHQTWGEGGSEWHRVTVTAYDVPRISRAWLDQEQADIGEWWFRQEYLCEFLEGEDQVFRDIDIDAAFTADVPALWTPAEG